MWFQILHNHINDIYTIYNIKILEYAYCYLIIYEYWQWLGWSDDVCFNLKHVSFDIKDLISFIKPPWTFDEVNIR